MSPLFNDRVTAGDGVVRTNDNTKRDYAEFMRRWSPESNRELTDAELKQREVLRTMSPASRPCHNDGDVDNLHFRIAGTTYRTKQQAEAEERQKREAQAHRDRLAAFEANEVMIQQTMDAYQLTPEEKAELTLQLGPRATDLAAIEWACERIMDLKRERL